MYGLVEGKVYESDEYGSGAEELHHRDVEQGGSIFGWGSVGGTSDREVLLYVLVVLMTIARLTSL